MNLASSYPSARYSSLLIAITVCLAASSAAAISNPDWGYLAVAAGAVVVVGIRDLLQRDHSILRNYPIIGHVRFFFESIRPEIRQYLFESKNEAAPFSRAQRSLVYQRAKNEEDKQPFGTEQDVYGNGYEWITTRCSRLH